MQIELGESVSVSPRLPELEVFWRRPMRLELLVCDTFRILRSLCKGNGSRLESIVIKKERLKMTQSLDVERVSESQQQP